MSRKTDPYASEEDTLSLIRKDTRAPAERKLDRMLEDRGASEQGAEPSLILRQIALELLAEQPVQQEPGRNHYEDGDVFERIAAMKRQPAQQEPVAWKLVPTEPTEEMLKAMDECSKEGYDERLYAGHAASVYMAAVDAAPTPPAQRKPLTVHEIAEFVGTHEYGPEQLKWFRFGEAAHGIKEKNT